MDGETCRRAAEEAGEGKWRGWMCCWVLLNVLTCMKGEGFILGPLRGCPQIWTHTHTQKGSEARKPGDGPDLPLYQSCFESCWCYAFLSLQHNTIFLEMDHKHTQGETIKSGQKRWHKKNNNAAKTVAMVIRSPTCSYVKRDLYWADTVSSTALCQECVCVCACVYSRRRQTK